MSKKYTNLSRANLNFQYLQANSTTHDFLFGAMAELVDNSRDAEANNLQIYTDINTNFRGNHLLCFLDDGTGMSPYEAADIIRFGKSFKKSSEKNYIGQYGNGLKSGSMRIGSDLLIFTKKDNIGTILLLSDTFLRQEGIDDIVVPLPSYDFKTKRPWFDPEIDEYSARERNDTELDVIYRFSPFKNLESLLAQFDKIGSSGTLAMIYNIILNSEGTTELDFETDKTDILMRSSRVDYDRKSQLEHRSFRAYVSILYSDPRMKIYIQGKKVHTKLLERNLYMPRMFLYRSAKFKNRAIQEKEAASQELTKSENDLREANSKLGDYVKRYSANQPPDYFIEKTKLRREVERCEKDREQKKRLVDRRTKEVNEQKELQFIFGINIHNRDADGLFIYNCSRLIIMFEHTKNQKKNSDYRGLVGIVNVPYVVSRPTHNKQKFTDMNEQKELIRVLGEHMDCYFNELRGTENSKEFWRPFGYFSNELEPPSLDEDSKRRRIQKSKICLQCDKCLKWRILRYNPKLLEDSYYKDDWTCEDNTDTSANNCSVAERLEGFQPMDFRKIKETNFNEIERTTTLIEPARPMPSQKSAMVTLVQKDRDECITRSIPPPVTKTLSERHSRNNGARSSVTESDSDTSLNGSKRPIEVIKKKRVRDSDDENDPEFTLYGNRNKNRSKSQAKAAATYKRVITNTAHNDDTFDTEGSSQQSQNNYENGVMGEVKSEPTEMRPVQYDNVIINPTSNGVASGNAADLNTYISITGKYRELLNTLASYSNEMPDLVRDLPNFSLEELNTVSLSRFIDRFKECINTLASKKYRAKRKQVKRIVSAALENKDEVAISESYKSQIMDKIDEVME